MYRPGDDSRGSNHGVHTCRRTCADSDAIPSCVKTLFEQAPLAGHLEGTFMELNIHTGGWALFSGIEGVTSGHIKYAMEAEYWAHIFLPTKGVQDAPGVVSERLQDNSWTSPRTAGNDPPYLYRYNLEIVLVPFDTDELQRALTIIESLSVHKLYWAALSKEERYSNFSISSILVPSTHVRQINSIWVDDRPRWEIPMDRLMSQWSRPAIYSTVMLAVDISFLAVLVIGQRPPAQISMVSLVVSVLLVQSGRHQDSINRATAFMTRMTRSFHGEGGLAIIFSLLYAPVIWWTISKGGTSIPQERATEQEFDALDVDLQHQYAQDVPLPVCCSASYDQVGVQREDHHASLVSGQKGMPLNNIFCARITMGITMSITMNAYVPGPVYTLLLQGSAEEHSRVRTYSPFVEDGSYSKHGH
ncbi:hypothetical protein EDB19DRAFT_1835203, partial [Suillus lakei]